MGAFARPPIFLRRSHHTSLTLPDPRLFIIRVSAELIRSKGDQTMTVEQLTAEIIPRGRGARSIPARQRTLYASRAPRPPPRRLLTASSHRLCAACRDGAGRDQVRAAAADTALRRAAVVSARGTARRRCRGLGRRGWGRGDPSCLKHAVGSSQLLWSRRTRGHREQAEIRAEGRRWGSQHAHRRRREVSCGRRGARQTRVCGVGRLALAAVASRASHLTHWDRPQAHWLYTAQYDCTKSTHNYTEFTLCFAALGVAAIASRSQHPTRPPALQVRPESRGCL